ncbi:MAG TPA: amino acid adenylation domain-containing protein, partial [Blastocatellia bacterium]|nr:amino acid adenylation domain-containing protein [Blastocatellia bacterium]
MSDYSTRLANLSRAKLQLLARHLKSKEEHSAPRLSLRRREKDDPSAPLSFAQERLWFLDQMNPGDPAYNVSCAVSLRGSLDAKALELSLSEIVRRHEVLRTTLVMRGGIATQVIHEYEPLSLPLVELSALSESRRQEEMMALAVADDRRAFDLARGPLFRSCLLKLDRFEHVLLLSMHHVVADAWSIGVLVRELTALYEAFSTGKPSPLPELPIQYADFALWQREWLKGEVLDKQVSYWKERIGSSPPSLELPTDRRRPAFHSSKGETQTLVLGPDICEALSQRCQQMQVTQFVWLLATFNVLLYRYSGQEDMLVGTPIACRNRGEIEGLIGFFVNTLVMRTELSGKPSFRDVVSRVRDAALAAHAHQDLPLEKLVEELQPGRSLNRQPLFQVVFSLQNAPMPDVRLSGLSLKMLETQRSTSKFDLLLFVRESDEGLACSMEYDTDLFDSETIRRMLSHFRVLLERVMEDPDRRIAEVPLLTEGERKEILFDWNATSSPYPAHACIHELFQAQASLTPDSIALAWADQSLSYRDLNSRANQLAGFLLSLGLGPDSLTAVCLRRSPDLIVALLAILKAGGAYLPLDPDYPLDRLDFMMEDSSIKLLLTHQSLAHLLPNRSGSLLCLDSRQAELSLFSPDDLNVELSPDNLAYAMYTSGSTGRPKAIAITHRGVVRLVKENTFARMDEREVFLQMAPVSFDASTFEIWGALLNGGKLVMMGEQKATLEEIGEAIAEYAVTTLWLTAGLFHQMVERNLEGLRGLRQLLAGGDVLRVEEVKKVLEGLEGIELINGYGPTESTTFASCEVMRRGYEVGQSVAIGRPIANTEVYVLDERMEAVPVGVTGEIYIGGAGLARGYIGRAELTAEKFLPHPHAVEGGRRLYRTGDLGRYRRDGAIEFIGREDNQVKIRGYRVELGEVEAALEEQEEVRQAVVVVKEGAGGDKRLVAYVESEGGREAEAEIRERLRKRVPEYMVPSGIEVIEEMPLTANGKVDRGGLPEERRRRRGGEEGEREEERARTPVEELLAGIWAELLGVARVGVDDDFFELGGHSLLSTQVMSRVSEVFKVSLPLRHLFESPTVAGLAQSVERAIREGRGVHRPSINTAPRDGELPLSFAQSRLWFLNQLEPDSPVYNVGSGLRLTGELLVDAMEKTFREIINRHESLRTSFTSVDGRPVQVIAPEPRFDLPLIDLSELPSGLRERELNLLAVEES